MVILVCNEWQLLLLHISMNGILAVLILSHTHKHALMLLYSTHKPYKSYGKYVYVYTLYQWEVYFTVITLYQPMSSHEWWIKESEVLMVSPFLWMGFLWFWFCHMTTTSTDALLCHTWITHQKIMLSSCPVRYSIILVKVSTTHAKLRSAVLLLS